MERRIGKHGRNRLRALRGLKKDRKEKNDRCQYEKGRIRLFDIRSHDAGKAVEGADGRTLPCSHRLSDRRPSLQLRLPPRLRS